jgi:hypothetical protein
MGPFFAEDLGLEEMLIQRLFFSKVSHSLTCGKLVQKAVLAPTLVLIAYRMSVETPRHVS